MYQSEAKNRYLQNSDRPNRVSIDLDSQVKTDLKVNPKKRIQIKTAKNSISDASKVTCEYISLLVGTENSSTEKNTKFMRTVPQLVEPKINNKQLYAYRQLSKNFQRACRLTGAEGNISEEKMAEVMTCMGYISCEESNQDKLLLNKAYNFLNVTSQGIKQDDLFFFLVVLSGVQFTLDHQSSDYSLWSCVTDSDRKRIKQEFSKFSLNKMSKSKINQDPNRAWSDCTFKPAILSSSKKMALSKRNKLLEEAHIQQAQGSSSKVEDFLIINGRLNEEKLRSKRKQKDQSEAYGCTFHPKINPDKNLEKPDRTEETLSSSKDRCIELFQNSRQFRRKSHQRVRSTLEELELKDLKECTFKPNFTKMRTSRSRAQVKNASRSVERLKEGRQIRVLTNALKQRGYPRNIPNWDHFVKCFKRQTSYQNIMKKNLSWRRCKKQQSWVPSNKKPISAINIQLINLVERIDIFDGDSIQSLTCKILVRHALPYEWKNKVAVLVQDSLKYDENVRLFNGFIYANTKRR